MAEPKIKDRQLGWALFDEAIARAAPNGVYSNPWVVENGALRFEPDLGTLKVLLAIPRGLRATPTTGVPAIALDVWTAYELRRAGFDPDAVWPRAKAPRVLPPAISRLLAGSIKTLRKQIEARLDSGDTFGGAVSSSANILGKNYVKQVDVGMSSWETGPELLISTKRMDSSFGKNAANRVEESYGDAKNLRLRHPQAALGFLYAMNAAVLEEEPKKALWLVDLLGKLGREDDAYHAVSLLLPRYHDDAPPGDDDGSDATEDAGLEAPDADSGTPALPSEVPLTLDSLPEVSLELDHVPDNLKPGTFFRLIVTRVLENTPVNLHEEARVRYANPTIRS